MAGTILTKLLGALKSFLKSMTSPLGGYEIQDAKVNSKDGEYSVLYQFAGKAVTQGKSGETEEVDNALMTESGEALTDVEGNAIQLDVLVSTMNVKEAIGPLLSGLNDIDKLYKENPKEASNLLWVLLGEGRESGVEEEDEHQEVGDSVKLPNGLISIHAVSDNSLAYAQSKGTGLLGENLANNNPLPKDTVTYAGKQWSWDKIAGDYLRYGLECQVPGKDYGAIENVTLSECQNLVSEYLVNMNVIQNKDEVKIDVINFVRPILLRLQSDLADYYNAAYEKYATLKDVKDTSKEDKEAQANADAEANKAEPDQRAVFDPEGKLAEYVDLSTPEGQARLEELQSQGYSIMDSKRITAKLRKVQGSTDFELLGLKSNYSPSETLSDLDDVISQDEFLLALPEEVQTYNIDVDDSGYDISTCEDCEISPCDSLGKVLQTGIKFYRNLYILHWMAKGNDMMKLHLMTEEMYSELIQEIDTLGELMVEQCGTVISPSFGCDYLEIRSYEFQEGIHIIEDYIQEYIDIIDYAYPNQTSDVQSTLDEWLRYWNKQMNYFVMRQEE